MHTCLEETSIWKTSLMHVEFEDPIGGQEHMIMSDLGFGISSGSDYLRWTNTFTLDWMSSLTVALSPIQK